KKLITLILTALTAVCMCIPVFAEEPDSAGNIRAAGPVVDLPSVPFFGAMAAGQNVSMKDTEAEGSVMAAGMTINISGSKIGESLYTAGYSVNVESTEVDGNVFAAGSSITFDENSKGNGVYATGNELVFSGEAKALNARASHVTLSGTINGNADIEADTVDITEDAVITGELKIKSSNNPNLSEAAEINEYSFEQVSKEEEEKAGKAEKAEKAKKSVITGIIAAFFKKLTRCLYWMIAMAAFGMLLTWLFNAHLDRASLYIRKRTGAMIGSGIVGWIAIPAAAVILCCTIILAPAGGMLLLAYVLLLCAGLAFAGASLARLIFPEMNVFLSALIGIAALEIVRSLPFIGILVGVAADMYLIAYVIQYTWECRYKKNNQTQTAKEESPRTEE
ncbi:MAG: hypothetical protein K5985_10205, partial [Lachnospiraceae bacterium]|nr:hypothetical protein [Lachnospiraceae bacterium]